MKEKDVLNENQAADILSAERAAREKQDANLFFLLRQHMAKVPDFRPPAVHEGFTCPMPGDCDDESQNEYRSAGALLSSLAAEFAAWRDTLPEQFTPAILAVMHGGIQIQVQSLAQVSFDGIRIEGLLEGKPCSLLAHQSTVQLLCYAEEVGDSEEARPIGFIWPDRNIEV